MPGPIGNIPVQITGDFSELKAALDQATQAAERGAQQITDAINKSGSAAQDSADKFQQMAQSLVAIGSALAITDGLKQFGEQALTAAGTVQSVEVALTHLTGSAEEAKGAIEDIKELAATEPFAFPDIAPAIQKMVALGVSIEQLPDAMHAVADAAAATGNDFQTVANAFDRMALSGNAGARQLTQLGVSTADLGRVMGITADEVKDAFKELDESQRIDVLTEAMGKFAGSAQAQAETISGAWQLFKNQFEEVMVAVGDALAPAVADILEFGKTVLTEIQHAVEAFNSLPGPVKEVAGAMGIMVASVAPLAAGIGTLGLGLAGIQAATGPLITLLQNLGIAGGEAAAGEEAAAVAAEHLATAEGAASAGGAAQAIAETGAAAVAAEAGAEGLATALGGFAAVAAGPVIASLIAFKSNLDDLKAKWDQFHEELISHSIVEAINEGETVKALQNIGYTVDQIKTAFKDSGVSAASVFSQIAESAEPPLKAITNLGISVEDVQKKLKDIQVDGIPAFALLASSPGIAQFQQQISAMGGNLDLIIKKLGELHVPLSGAAKDFQDYASAFGIVVENGDRAQKALDGLTEKQEQANQAVKDASAVLDAARKGLDGTQESQQVYTRALIAYQDALDKATPKSKDFADSIAGISKAVSDAQQKFDSAQATFSKMLELFEQGSKSAAEMGAAYKKVQSAAEAIGQSFVNVEAEVVKATTAFEKHQAEVAADEQIYEAFLKQVSSGNADAIPAAIDAYGKWQAAAKAVGDAISSAAGESLKFTQQAEQQITQINADIQAFAGLAQAGNNNIQTLLAQQEAFRKVASEASALGVQIKQVGDTYVLSANEITPATQAVIDQLQQWMAQQGLLVQVTENGITVVHNAALGITELRGSMADARSEAELLAQGINDASEALDEDTHSLVDATTAAYNAATAVNSLAQADRDLAAAADEASTKQSGVGRGGRGGGGGGGGGGSVSLSAYLEDVVALAQSPLASVNGATLSSYIDPIIDYLNGPLGGSASSLGAGGSTANLAVSAANASSALNQVARSSNSTTSALGSTTTALTEQQRVQLLFGHGMQLVSDSSNNTAKALGLVADAATGAAASVSFSGNTLSDAVGQLSDSIDSLPIIAERDQPGGVPTDPNVQRLYPGTALLAAGDPRNLSFTQQASPPAEIQGGPRSDTSAFALSAPSVAQGPISAAAPRPEAALTSAQQNYLNFIKQGSTEVPVPRTPDFVFGSPAAPAVAPPLTISINLTAGTVVGSGGMDELAQRVSDQVNTQLKQIAGLKIF